MTQKLQYFHLLIKVPTLVKIGAVDADGIVSISGTNVDTLNIRSGRLRVSNNYGENDDDIYSNIQAQYWSGTTWVLNGLDNCTVIDQSSVALASYVDMKGAPTTNLDVKVVGTTLSNGVGRLQFNQLNAGESGTVYFALNLGGTTADNSCLTNHPTSVGAEKAWFRSAYGANCSVNGDPSAMVTFGLMKNNSSRIIFQQEVY
jgi:MSHA biogenesis protein MshQ